VLTQLPERVDSRIFVPLTPQQRIHHDENGGIVMRIVSRWRKTGYLSDTDQRVLQCSLQNMRMACNSTYLLDHETDYGEKVDELMTLLDELLEAPEAKAVVFSQWLGTHELIVRRLAQRGWGHVLFSGSVPSEQRGALVERFHSDANCRLFLSTDAGGVGLNLQHAAAVVINMDLPWNPAVLEQRIGRVHRMGQSRGVQVVNFVGQGSIEEGMLSVLAFKKSLFAGVLDGGAHEVFLQGTRLSQFMQSVEKVASAMGEADDDTAAKSPAAPGAAETPPDATEVPQARAEESVGAATQATTQRTEPADPWAAILEAGATVLQGLASARAANGAAPIAIERDPVTGQASVRLPLPEPEVLHRLAKAFEPWLR
ncbi:MAG: helicase-related protein, partial [Burkholderiaceae bacterium]|nr:helicase-related protein [Burkholderiaceae bacterium]